MLNCGPGNSCCGSCAAVQPTTNLGGAFPATERVLTNYIRQQQALGKSWYISPQLNSDVYDGGTGLGFLPIFAAIGSAAAAIGAKVVALGPTIASVAGTAGSIKAMTGGGGSSAAGPTAEDIAAAVTPAVAAQLKAQGITLPNDVAQAAVSGSILDAFGSANRPYVIAGGIGLGLLLLMTLMRR